MKNHFKVKIELRTLDTRHWRSNHWALVMEDQYITEALNLAPSVRVRNSKKSKNFFTVFRKMLITEYSSSAH